MTCVSCSRYRESLLGEHVTSSYEPKIDAEYPDLLIFIPVSPTLMCKTRSRLVPVGGKPRSMADPETERS